MKWVINTLYFFLSISLTVFQCNKTNVANGALTKLDKQVETVEEDEALIVTPEEGGRRRRGSRGEVEDDTLDRTGTFRSGKSHWKTANR